MVVDFDKFTPGGPLPEKDLLWIAEQIPGTVGVKDVTSVLTEQGFWPSYNVPYLDEIYTKSGLPTTGENTYDNASRALIFKRDGKPQRLAPTGEILSKRSGTNAAVDSAQGLEHRGVQEDHALQRL